MGGRTYTFCGTPGYGKDLLVLVTHACPCWCLRLHHRHTCTGCLLLYSPAIIELTPLIHIHPRAVAPENIMGRGYNQSVDWWTLGVLM